MYKHCLCQLRVVSTDRDAKRRFDWRFRRLGGKVKKCASCGKHRKSDVRGQVPVAG
jgi:hypothetical protein